MDPMTIFFFIVFFVLGLIASQLIHMLRHPQEHNNVLRMWEEDEKINIELDGQVMSTPEIATPGQHARLEELMLVIKQWLLASQSTEEAPKKSVEEGLPPFSSIKKVAQEERTYSTPRLDIFQDAKKVLSDMVISQPTDTSSGIIKQIDWILQKKLAQNPIGDKVVSLEEDKLGEVVIIVGAVRYKGIEAVPDPEIRAVIQEAISEWEKGSSTS